MIVLRTDSGEIMGGVVFENFQIPRLLAVKNSRFLRLITEMYGSIYILYDDEKINDKLKTYFKVFDFEGVKYGFRGDYPSPKYIWDKDKLYATLVDYKTFVTSVKNPNDKIRRTNIKLTYLDEPSPEFDLKSNPYFTELFEEIPSIAIAYVKDNQPPLYRYMLNRKTYRDSCIKSMNLANKLFSKIIKNPYTAKHFSVELANNLYRIFGSKKVLDPSAGWADRLAGAAMAGVEEYTGVDPNSNLRDMYWSIKQYLFNKSVTKITTIEDGFLEAEVKDNYYDTILTSPPYWNYEIYSNDEKQSINSHPNLDKWITEFMFPYIQKCSNCLTDKGVFILRMSDTSAGYYMAEVMTYIKKETDMKFRGVIAITGSADPCLVFSKPKWIPITIDKFVGGKVSLQEKTETLYFRDLMNYSYYDEILYFRSFSPLNLLKAVNGQLVVIFTKKETSDTLEARKLGALVELTDDPASSAFLYSRNKTTVIIPSINLERSKEVYLNSVEKIYNTYIPRDFKGTLYVESSHTFNALTTLQIGNIVKYEKQVVSDIDLIWN